MSRYLFAPAAPFARIAYPRRAKTWAGAGAEVDLDDDYAAYIIGAVPGVGDLPSLIPLLDERMPDEPDAEYFGITPEPEAPEPGASSILITPEAAIGLSIAEPPPAPKPRKSSKPRRK